MFRNTTLGLLLALGGCTPLGAWQPTVSASPGFDEEIPREAFADGCSVQWESLLLGIAGGELRDELDLATATLPGDQALELRDSGGITLAQMHIPIRPRQSSFRIRLGPPEHVVSSPYEGPCPTGDCGDDGRGAPDNPVLGNASAEQRTFLRDADIGGHVAGILGCGKGTALRFQWNLPQGTIECPIPSWELPAADSAVTWVDFAFHHLFGTTTVAPGESGELLGRPWLDADLDENGELDSAELTGQTAESLGLPGGESNLEDWLRERTMELASLDGTSACTWTDDRP